MCVGGGGGGGGGAESGNGWEARGDSAVVLTDIQRLMTSLERSVVKLLGLAYI